MHDRVLRSEKGSGEGLVLTSECYMELLIKTAPFSGTFSIHLYI